MLNAQSSQYGSPPTKPAQEMPISMGSSEMAMGTPSRLTALSRGSTRTDLKRAKSQGLSMLQKYHHLCMVNVIRAELHGSACYWFTTSCILFISIDTGQSALISNHVVPSPRLLHVCMNFQREEN